MTYPENKSIDKELNTWAEFIKEMLEGVK